MVREHDLVLTHEESSNSVSRRGGWLHVQTIQEDLGQHQQLGEVVETKVDHHTSKTHNLGGEGEGGREKEGGGGGEREGGGEGEREREKERERGREREREKGVGGGGEIYIVEYRYIDTILFYCR